MSSRDQIYDMHLTNDLEVHQGTGILVAGMRCVLNEVEQMRAREGTKSLAGELLRRLGIASIALVQYALIDHVWRMHHDAKHAAAVVGFDGTASH